MKNYDEKVTIKIPRPLYVKLKTIIEETGFNSVTEFIVYILRDLSAGKASPPEDHMDLTKKEIEIVRQKLKNLGYFI